MTHSHITLSCRCGQVAMEAAGAPLMSVECCCTTCRDAGRRFELLPGAVPILTEHGATAYAMYRKDRVQLADGAALLREHRLEPDARTRRVLASCCNTPMFLEFMSGHWLSVYADLWPLETRPALQMRTMCRSVEDGVTLPDDVPNPSTHTAGFMACLLVAFVAMRFRKPRFEISGTLEA